MHVHVFDSAEAAAASGLPREAARQVLDLPGWPLHPGGAFAGHALAKARPPVQADVVPAELAPSEQGLSKTLRHRRLGSTLLTRGGVGCCHRGVHLRPQVREAARERQCKQPQLLNNCGGQRHHPPVGPLPLQAVRPIKDARDLLAVLNHMSDAAQKLLKGLPVAPPSSHNNEEQLAKGTSAIGRCLRSPPSPSIWQPKARNLVANLTSF